MKQKIKLLMLCIVLALCMAACGNQPVSQADTTSGSETLSQTEEKPAETEQPETEDTAPEQAAAGSAEGFDMERIRKSIIIKGQPFELPTALCDLGEGWTWEEDELFYYGPDGEGLVTIYYNGEEWFHCGVNNYYEGNEEQGTVCNIAIKTSDCSIDGLIPGETTKQEVVERYGEPTEVITEGLSDGSYVYRYVADDNGTKPANEGPRISINILDDVVMLVSITYE